MTGTRLGPYEIAAIYGLDEGLPRGNPGALPFGA
jgi:hypothetical protein